MAVDLLPLLAFGIATYGALPLVHADKTINLVALSVINAILAARGINSIARTIPAPRWMEDAFIH
jgi:hypothetical protein